MLPPLPPTGTGTALLPELPEHAAPAGLDLSALRRLVRRVPRLLDRGALVPANVVHHERDALVVFFLLLALLIHAGLSGAVHVP